MKKQPTSLSDPNFLQNTIPTKKLIQKESNQSEFQQQVPDNLKPDFKELPFQITKDSHIFLETFSPYYRIAYELLIAIAEPVSRPAYIHEYKLTQQSLYTAMSLQLTKDHIINMLEKLCKNDKLPKSVIDFIEKYTRNYGLTKVQMKNGNQQLETNDETLQKTILPGIMDRLEEVKDPFAEKMEIEAKNEESKIIEEKDEKIIEAIETLALQTKETTNIKKEKSRFFLIKEQSTTELSEEAQIEEHFKVTRYFIEQNIPILEEQDFAQDSTTPRLDIELKPSTKIRAYQEKALSKIFIYGKARPGVIVLPCGAGKTLVGCIAIATIKRSTIVFCCNDFSAMQWEEQLKKFTDIKSNQIMKLLSRNITKKESEKILKNFLKNTGLVILTTYSFLAQMKRESKNEATQRKGEIREKVQGIEFGVCILDEVHVVPANTFQRAVSRIKTHLKIGLTATLLREDEKIEDLNYMIGPKLYEENWLDLVNEGYLARPYCVEVRCEMVPMFLKEQQKSTTDHQTKQLLQQGNPNKFLSLQQLIKRHRARNDKILVFCDRVRLAEIYSNILNIPLIYGKTNQKEREDKLKQFQKSSKDNILMLSRVGDLALDLPEANVAIEICAHFGSRKQEAQRLGRILRPKTSWEGEEFDSFFQSLVSLKTDETFYAQKRQRFLIDQGFSFAIISELPYQKDEKLLKEFKLGDSGSQESHLAVLLKFGAMKAKESDVEIDEANNEFEEDSDTEVIENEPKLVHPFGNNAYLHIEHEKPIK